MSNCLIYEHLFTERTQEMLQIRPFGHNYSP